MMIKLFSFKEINFLKGTYEMMSLFSLFSCLSSNFRDCCLKHFGWLDVSVALLFFRLDTMLVPFSSVSGLFPLSAGTGWCTERLGLLLQLIGYCLEERHIPSRQLWIFGSIRHSQDNGFCKVETQCSFIKPVFFHFSEIYMLLNFSSTTIY